ncbi:MAG: response regulator [Deferrisomatales bacterium]|nr:response regulator [Deferrisomatales bacterium]
MEASAQTDPPHRILVADDEADITAVLGHILTAQGYEVTTTDNGADAWERARAEPYDAILTDLKMPRMGGLELLRRVKEARSPSAVIVMTGFATVETAIEALKIGAYDYIVKPFKVDELLQLVERALEKVRLEAENLQLREQIALLRLSEAVASSLSLDDVLGIVVEAALKEVDADGVELLFRPPGSAEYSRRLSLRPDGASDPVLADVPGLEGLMQDAAHLQVRGERLAPLLVPRHSDRVRTLLAVPLRRGGQMLGVLNAYTHKVRKGFLPREEKALMVLGDRAATSLENALLFADLQNTFADTIQSLALALEAKDAYTHGHSANVTRLCQATAGEMGLDGAFCATLRQAGILHDIGKIGISSSILNKPDRLTAEEYEAIKMHPRVGQRILKPIKFLQDVAPIVYHHHEHWDGKGYPDGLAGEEIPLGSRLMLVADTYDAMTSDRAYRPGLSHEVALAELRRCAGAQLDPQCVEAFLRSWENPREND